jgi:hypothetical protein
MFQSVGDGFLHLHGIFFSTGSAATPDVYNLVARGFKSLRRWFDGPDPKGNPRPIRQS